jgi:S-adenosylmethionine-diacylglycerol 3-amino-3-carboxypropyl transferase
MRSEIQDRAEFARVRYGQCWEDADVLVGALSPNGRRCVSIGSAGDNSFALLAAGARAVDVVEMNPAQVACIELRRAAYLTLEHEEFLEMLGARESDRRAEWYARCRGTMDAAGRAFWDARPGDIARGVIHAGRFENYFRLFRERVLPLAHGRSRVDALLRPRDPEGRRAFYDREWNNLRWRLLFLVFFSRPVMGALGRDPEFFRYVEGSVSDRILERTRHALVELEPAENPYLHWILRGRFGGALPLALREEHFATIRHALADGRLCVHDGTLESWLDRDESRGSGAFNLSDIFEYMSEANAARVLAMVADRAEPGARIAYWNMLAPRACPPELQHRIRSVPGAGEAGLRADRAFFYSRFVVEEVIG